MQNVIFAENISKQFKMTNWKAGMLEESKYFEAVHDVSFQIAEGEMVGLTGPNGAGKSTILNMLSGIYLPNSGKISVLGLDSAKDRKKYVEHIGAFSAERSQLYYAISIKESLEWNARFYGVKGETLKKRLAVLAELFEVEDVIQKKREEVSFGEKMRLELISVLLHQPKVLLLDEPTLGVDVTAKDTIHKCLIEMNRMNGLSVILVSHDKDDIKAVCSRTICLKKGKIEKIEKIEKEDEISFGDFIPKGGLKG